MRKLISLVLIAGCSAGASAHPLPGDEPIAAQLSHQLLSMHHAGVIFVVLVAAALLMRAAIAWMAQRKQ
jgi:hypothetical protein